MDCILQRVTAELMCWFKTQNFHPQTLLQKTKIVEDEVESIRIQNKASMTRRRIAQ